MFVYILSNIITKITKLFIEVISFPHWVVLLHSYFVSFVQGCFILLRQAKQSVLFSSSVVFLGLVGCGEHLVRTILARECSHALQAEDAHQALLETMQNKFISKCNFGKRTPSPYRAFS